MGVIKYFDLLSAGNRQLTYTIHAPIRSTSHEKTIHSVILRCQSENFYYKIGPLRLLRQLLIQIRSNIINIIRIDKVKHTRIFFAD